MKIPVIQNKLLLSPTPLGYKIMNDVEQQFTPKIIVVHSNAVHEQCAQEVFNWFQNWTPERSDGHGHKLGPSSANYVIDNDQKYNVIYRMADDKRATWHCGPQENLTPFYKELRAKLGLRPFANENTIGIEVCEGKICSYKKKWAEGPKCGIISGTSFTILADLVKYFMCVYNIQPDCVIRHWDTTHKGCPSYYGGDDNGRWLSFKSIL